MIDILGVIYTCCVFILSNVLCFFNFTGFDEPEERFVLTIYKVSGNGSIDGLQSNITITIAKHGHPNGVFRFQNTATKTFDEPASGVEQQAFTVERENGTQGTVNVSVLHMKLVLSKTRIRRLDLNKIFEGFSVCYLCNSRFRSLIHDFR